MIEREGFLKTTSESREGTPQGGVISPLLVNIALDGLEQEIRKRVVSKIGVKKARSLTVVRYADDMLVLHSDLQVVEFCHKVIKVFLLGMNLELNPDKTAIRHSYLSHKGKTPGVNYLGFNIRQYGVGKYRRGKLKNPYKTLIKPQKQAVTRHMKNLKKVVDTHVKADVMIGILNPKIRG